MRNLSSHTAIRDLFEAAQALANATPVAKGETVEWIKLRYALTACRDAIATAEAYQAEAEALRGGDDLEVDDNFLVSETENGVWVSSWSWVEMDHDKG